MTVVPDGLIFTKNYKPFESRDVKPYKFKDDLTYVGLPIFTAGILAKAEKHSFRQNTKDALHSRTRLLSSFKTEVDNYTQLVPFFAATGLQLAGVDGRSDLYRYAASSLMAYGTMALFVNSIKYTAKEMRPDGSTANSWPSGHTATAFVSAGILHHEYGLTRSPWYSVAGYACATATGVMRVLNNRHWVSDVLSGAGIGILSTELAYGFSDLLFKGSHLKRGYLDTRNNIIEHPSYFGISMGMGFGSRTLDFSLDEMGLQDYPGEKMGIKLSTSTVVGAEGAYFLNKYVGVGGRLRVASSPVKGWGEFLDMATKNNDELEESMKIDADDEKSFTSREIQIQSDHITEFTGDFGVYFNFPLSSRLALGSKLLVGRSITQDLDIDCHMTGYPIEYYNDRACTNRYSFTNSEDFIYRLAEIPGYAPLYSKSGDTPYDTTWDLVTISGNNSTKFGTGLSLTYAYKNSYSWKLFVDYDYTRKHYTLEYNPFGVISSLSPETYMAINDPSLDDNLDSIYRSHLKKNMNTFVVGAAFAISF